MATIESINRGIPEAQRLANLAKQQAAVDISEGAKQIFVPGTSTVARPLNVFVPKEPTKADTLASFSDLEQQLKRFQEEFIASRLPTEEEKQAELALQQTRIRGLQAQAGAFGQEAEALQQPIPKAIGGVQLADIQRRLSLEQQRIATEVLPLELKLQRLQKERETKAESLKTLLGFAEKRVEKQLDIALQLQKITRPDVVSTQVNKTTGDVFSFVMDPIVGTTRSVKIGNIGAEVAKEFDVQSTWISNNDRQMIAGTNLKTGKFEVKDVGATRKRDDLLSALRAVNLRNITQASPGQVINAATNTPIDLTNEQAIRVADFQTLLTATGRVSGLLDQVNSTGAIKGWILKQGIYWPVIQRELNSQELELMQEMYRISNQYVYLVSGKQINEQEYLRLSKTVPDVRATKENNKVVMGNFTRYLQDGYSNYLRVNGWRINEPDGRSLPLKTGVDISDLNFKF